MKKCIKAWADKHSDWLDDNLIWLQLLSILVLGILVNVVFWNLIFPLFEKPPYVVEAHVSDVGYRGVTVEYTGQYGGLERSLVDTDVDGYSIGDTVTVELSGRVCVITQ